MASQRQPAACKQQAKTATLKNGNPINRAGRKKGSRNKYTTLKDAFLKAFDELGGVDGLVKWAKRSSQNRATFYKLVAHMLPSNVDVTMPDTINITISSDFKPDLPDNKPVEDTGTNHS